ncbi:MAG: Ig-like domain-containing protein [Pseudonocardiaceae bacterium]
MTPTNAAGTVQFRDGNTVIATAGVIPFTGLAGPQIVFLPPGPHSITATFVPANPAAFQPSTSSPPRTFTF